MYQASQVASRRLIPPAPRPEPILPVAPRGLTTAPLVRSIGCEQSQPFIALPYPTLPTLERYETRASFVASRPRFWSPRSRWQGPGSVDSLRGTLV